MSGSFTDLYSKIFHDDAHIDLDEDIEIKLFERIEKRFPKGITIKNKNTVIDGHDYCIDAKGSTRIFNIIGGNVTLKNITLKNGKVKKHGGAIRNSRGKIDLINCNFINNKSKKEGKDLSNGYTSIARIENSEFSQNSKKYPIWNLGEINVLEDEEDQIKSITNDSKIIVLNNKTETQLSIIDVDTNKFTGEKHIITVKLSDENGNPISNQAIQLENEFSAITNKKGEAILIYQSDVSDEIDLSIKYEGYSYLNYLKAQPVSCHLITNEHRESASQEDIKTEKHYQDVNNKQEKSYQEKAPFEAYKGDDDYIFVSYAHIDAEEVYKDIDEFNKDEDINIWYDDGIPVSKEWPEVLQNKIESCTAFLVFISDNSVESFNVRNEVTFALGKNKPCIQIYLNDTELKYGLGLTMANIQAILKHTLSPEQYKTKCQEAFQKKFKSEHK